MLDLGLHQELWPQAAQRAPLAGTLAGGAQPTSMGAARRAQGLGSRRPRGEGVLVGRSPRKLGVSLQLRGPVPPTLGSSQATGST